MSVYISFFIALLFIGVPKAHAYINPGESSLALQTMVAGFLAVSIFWRQITTFVKGIFFRKTSSKTSSLHDKTHTN